MCIAYLVEGLSRECVRQSYEWAFGIYLFPEIESRSICTLIPPNRGNLETWYVNISEILSGTEESLHP